MKPCVRIAGIFIAVLIYSQVAACESHVLSFAGFDRVTVYSEKRFPSHVVLYLSSGRGWSKPEAEMAAQLSALDTLVVGIDVRPFLDRLRKFHGPCSYPAAELEQLSKDVQRKFGFLHYVHPVLMGCDSGATLAYAALAQAPPTTFAGAITLNFCPELRITEPFCRGEGLYTKKTSAGLSFLPAEKLEPRWIALQGTVDKTCGEFDLRSYVKSIANSRWIELPPNSSTGQPLASALREAYAWLFQKPAVTSGALTQNVPEHVQQPSDLPLIEVPAQGKPSDILAIILTGDGGWASLDRQVGASLSEKGVGVVGFDSLQYFWTHRTVDQASNDLARTMNYYLAHWHKHKVLLIGYSFGADVLPFLANRLKPELLAQVSLISLLGPGREADFEFHITDWLGSSHSKDSQPVLPQVEKLKGKKILCVYGEKEEDSLCPSLDRSIATRMTFGSGHHFGGDYQAIAEKILNLE